MPVTAVDDLLSEHGLDRPSVIAFIDAGIRRGQGEAADEVQLLQQTVERCRETFESIAFKERAELIASLFGEWRDEA